VVTVADDAIAAPFIRQTTTVPAAFRHTRSLRPSPSWSPAASTIRHSGPNPATAAADAIDGPFIVHRYTVPDECFQTTSLRPSPL
jgi:hypothetical protein